MIGDLCEQFHGACSENALRSYFAEMGVATPAAIKAMLGVILVAVAAPAQSCRRAFS